MVYIDEEHKFDALADDIQSNAVPSVQPVLVGTVSIEKSEAGGPS